MTPVQAVIVNFNSGALLGGALDRIRDHAVSSTLVVDNASHDLSWQDALGRPGVRLERLESNVGFAAAVNRAMSSGDEPYLLLLNADVEMEPGYVARLAEALDGDSRLAGATGTLVLPSARIDSTGITLTTARWAMDRDRGLTSPSTRDEPFGVSGAAALMRRDALLQAGGLWEELFVYWEDTELAWRLRRAGWRFTHVPAARATHARGADLADPTFVEAADFGGRLATIARHEGWPGLLRPCALLVTLLTGTRLALRHPAALRTSRPRQRIRAGLDARRDDAHLGLLATAGFSPHPWGAWLVAQLSGRRRGLGAVPPTT
ncbi:MAG: glycosyltransferase family 2 protein [Actinobacteria bacterium]|nr:glycosyltransferase family 2 protein [Actinomycetota bacterium]